MMQGVTLCGDVCVGALYHARSSTMSCSSDFLQHLCVLFVLMVLVLVHFSIVLYAPSHEVC